MSTSLKVIHIVENLDKGAVENWLVNTFFETRKTRPEWHWTFYCILGREGRLDQKVRNAGGEIIYSPVSVSRKLAFLRSLRKVLIAGRYDIIHSHHDYLSGYYLTATAGIKFKKRVLQIHNTDKALPVGSRILSTLLLNPLRTLAMRLSDVILGISENTLQDFVRSGYKTSKHKLLYYGVDLDRFNVPADRFSLRNQFNIPTDGKVLLFAGRMNDLKNPDFVVDVLYHLLQKRKDVYALFVGKGDRETLVSEKARDLGIEKHIRIAGWHDDIPFVMKSSDVFVFPRKEHPKEGLGLVVVEAQAAGLPMFITRGIVQDAIVIKELAHCNSLADPAEWASQIWDILNGPQAISQFDALKRMKQSRFELANAARNLIDIYEH